MESEPMEYLEAEDGNELLSEEKKERSTVVGNEIPSGEETHEEDSDTSKICPNELETSSLNNSMYPIESNISRDHYFPDSSFQSEQFSINENTWQLGQLAWARMSTFPFWPCQITYDPSSSSQYQKVQSFGRSKTLAIHVHFFHDQGRHSWIPAHHMLPFFGIEDFRRQANAVSDQIRKKEPKFAAALIIKPSIFNQWQKAVADAMDVYQEIDFSALEDFKPKLKDLTNNIPKNGDTSTKKRKRKSDDNKKTKIFKSNDTNSSLSLSNKLELETPPVSPANEEDARAANIQKQKRISKKINALQPPEFDVFVDRNYSSVKDQYPDANDEHIREYLLDVWNNRMEQEDKIKYRATYKVEN